MEREVCPKEAAGSLLSGKMRTSCHAYGHPGVPRLGEIWALKEYRMWHSKVTRFFFLFFVSISLVVLGYTGLESSYTILVHSQELQILDCSILISENQKSNQLLNATYNSQVPKKSSSDDKALRSRAGLQFGSCLHLGTPSLFLSCPPMFLDVLHWPPLNSLAKLSLSLFSSGGGRKQHPGIPYTMLCLWKEQSENVSGGGDNYSYLSPS